MTSHIIRIIGDINELSRPGSNSAASPPPILVLLALLLAINGTAVLMRNKYAHRT